MMEKYQRTDAFDEEEFEDDLVVMNTRTQAVVALNGTARVVWEALAEGATHDDLVALFVEAFPDTDPKALERDVADILARLEKAELVAVAGDDG
ncbi:MAG: PqqD family protein [Alphaproteobacteria bacterium]